MSSLMCSLLMSVNYVRGNSRAGMEMLLSLLLSQWEIEYALLNPIQSLELCVLCLQRRDSNFHYLALCCSKICRSSILLEFLSFLNELCKLINENSADFLL
jgi:hypothetical protein